MEQGEGQHGCWVTVRGEQRERWCWSGEEYHGGDPGIDRVHHQDRGRETPKRTAKGHGCEPLGGFPIERAHPHVAGDEYHHPLESFHHQGHLKHPHGPNAVAAQRSWRALTVMCHGAETDECRPAGDPLSGLEVLHPAPTVPQRGRGKVSHPEPHMTVRPHTRTAATGGTWQQWAGSTPCGGQSPCCPTPPR